MNAPEGRVGDVGCSSRMNRLNECNKIKDRMSMYAGCGAGYYMQLCRGFA